MIAAFLARQLFGVSIKMYLIGAAIVLISGALLKLRSDYIEMGRQEVLAQIRGANQKAADEAQKRTEAQALCASRGLDWDRITGKCAQ